MSEKSPKKRPPPFTRADRTVRQKVTNIIQYPSGKHCHHCVWINKAYDIVGKNERMPNAGESFMIIHPPGTDGITVFDMCDFFKGTFMCAYGLPNMNSHNSENFTSILICCTKFIEFLNKQYGMRKIRLMINSKYDLYKNGGKEHLHALVTVDSKDDENILYNTVTKHRTVGRMIPAREPYPGDKIVKLDEEKARELLYSDNALGFICNEIGIKEKDAPSTSFYLFLRFDSDDKSVVGQISY